MAGPEHWVKIYPYALGKRQSPVSIDTSRVIDYPLTTSSTLSLSYDSNCCQSILNTGEGWKVCADESASYIEGGPLKHKYQLLQFHSHWGEHSDTGSEHTVDGKRYAAELHLVHWNVDLYQTPEKAMSSPQGLAVVAIFFKVGKSHPEITKVVEAFRDIPCKGKKTTLPEAINPSTLVPNNHAYWTYQGSLTTPPCYESVTWIIFKTVLEISKEQLDKFRSLLRHNQQELISSSPKGAIENCRPTQPLYNRLVYEGV